MKIKVRWQPDFETIHFSISMVTPSSAFSQRGGFCAMPPQCGVPVKITGTGTKVVLPLKNSISVGTSKIIVFQSCMVWPFSTVRIFGVFGLGISLRVTSIGPADGICRNFSHSYF